MKKTYILGHKIPDTDCTLSGIVYSEYLNSKRMDTEVIKLGELNNETKYILEFLGVKSPKTRVTLPEGSDIILMDHNDKSQSIDNLNDLNIVGLVDHHNFGNFCTTKPVKVRCEPLCSTCSVLYKMFMEKSYTIPKKSACMLIAAIISDSLYFRSPTTTKEDIKIVESLNEIAQIKNLEDFAINMFAAKSDLGDISAEEIIKTDYKEFEVNSKRFGVGVLETTNPSYALNKEKEIIEGLKNIKNKSNLDFIMFCVVDIFNESNIAFSGDIENKKIIEKMFNKKFDGNKIVLGRILSRKKQIIPLLNEYFN